MRYRERDCRIRASATLEAALVIPIYIYAVLAIMYVIRLVNIYLDVDKAAYDSAREIAKYAYEYNDNGSLSILKARLYTSFVSDIGMKYGKDNYIVGGLAGFNLMDSHVCDDNSQIDVQVKYIVKNPFDIFGIGLIHVRQGVMAEAWLGEEASGEWDESFKGNADAEDDKEHRKVYVTPWGKAYHISSECSAIDLSIQTAAVTDIGDRRNSDGGKYYPCEECGKDADGTVYITDYGDRYHTSMNCAGLKRTIEEIDITEAGDRSECKRCGGNHK